MSKLKFPKKQVWNKTNNDEWRMCGVFNIYTLSEYGDDSWHIRYNAANYGSVVDRVNGVTTLEKAKDYTYKMACDYLQNKYEESHRFIRSMGIYND